MSQAAGTVYLKGVCGGGVWRDSTVDRVIALYEAEPGSIPQTNKKIVCAGERGGECGRIMVQ